MKQSHEDAIHWPDHLAGVCVAGALPLCGEPRNPHVKPMQFTEIAGAVDCDGCIEASKNTPVLLGGGVDDIVSTTVPVQMSVEPAFKYHKPNADQARQMDELRAQFSTLKILLLTFCPAGNRHREWALKDMESAAMWSNKAITHTPERS